MTDERLLALLEKGLAVQGNLYTVGDILAEIEAGTKQGFVEGDTWAITSIMRFPRRKVLQVELIVGTLDDTDVIDKRLEAFAIENGCTLIISEARPGWRYAVRQRPQWSKWREVRTVWYKDLT